MSCGCNKNDSEHKEHHDCGCHHEHNEHCGCENDHFGIADMSEEDKIALKEKEDKLKMETGKDFILIAYEKNN